jgi:hypothetical protein
MRCFTWVTSGNQELTSSVYAMLQAPSLGPGTGGKLWRTSIRKLCGPLVALGLGMPGEDLAAARDSMMATEDDMRTSKGSKGDRAVIPPASAKGRRESSAKPLSGKLTRR